MSIPTHAERECWVWFSLAITIVLIRYVSQYIVRKRNFLRKIPGDDILMAVIVVIYTISVVSLYLYIVDSATIDFDHITPEDETRAGRRLGILNILGETAMQTTLWGNKVCILLLYNRLTLLGHDHKVLVTLSMFVGLSYIAVIVTLYGGWCRPFSDYLVLQPQNLECLTWLNYNILQLSMNLSTDLVLLLIPVILISRMKMKIGKKLLLIALFSMGIFVMLSSILLKVAVFSNSFDPVWLIWCIREVSTAMLVGNLVLCMPIFKIWWKFFSSRIGSLRKGFTASGNSDMKGITQDPQSAGCKTTTTMSESGYSRWDSIAVLPQSPTDYGPMVDADLEEHGGAGTTDRRLSLRLGV